MASAQCYLAALLLARLRLVDHKNVGRLVRQWAGPAFRRGLKGGWG